MSDRDRDDVPRPLRQGWADLERDAEADRPELHLVPRDTSFEHALDETAPRPEPVHEGDGIEIPHLGGERRPIVPEHLRTWKGVRSTAGKHLDAARFHALFHLLRVPMYLVLGIVWAVVGVVKIARAQRRWWWVSEQAPLRTKAVLDGNPAEWRALTRRDSVLSWG